MAYDNTPGARADAPASWPAESALTRDPAAPTLVMLAHPRCDCTRASLGELAELLARVKVKPRTFVVFIKPGGTASGWEQSGTWEQAKRIPGVTVVRDDDGAEARRFGVQTSGQTLLYDARGHLLYSGGTTGSRGKAGENAGRADLVALVDGARRPRATRPVFGCPLFASRAGGADAGRGEANGDEYRSYGDGRQCRVRGARERMPCFAGISRRSIGRRIGCSRT